MIGPSVSSSARPVLVLLMVGLALPSAACAGSTTAGLDPLSTEKYWIFLAPRPDSTLTGRAGWAAPVAPSYLRRLRARGVTPVVQSRWFHAVSARLSPDQRRRVTALSFVRRVRPVAWLTPTAAGATSRAGEQARPTDSLRPGASASHLRRMHALPPLRRGIDGHGVRVGFLDAHLRGLRHPALSHLRRTGRLRALYDFTERRQGGTHGQAVVSVAAGRAPGTLLGPAHGAQVLGATTEYTQFERNVEEDYFVAGLEWLHRRGADVVNVSIGYTRFDEGQRSYAPDDLDGNTALTTRAVDRAARKGLTVVVSAGNEGCASPDSCWYYVNTPADADSAITVGAIRPDSSVADFSSRGPTADGRREPDVVVQGTGVVAAWEDQRFARVGGTSFASPQVTGVVAQMLQVNPALSPVAVRRLLRSTAAHPDAPNNRVGWGVVDAAAAVRAAERAARSDPPTRLHVRSVRSSGGRPSTLQVSVPAGGSSLRLSIVDRWGRTVRTTEHVVRPGPNRLSLSLRALPPGPYYYRLQGPDAVRTGLLPVSGVPNSHP